LAAGPGAGAKAASPFTLARPNVIIMGNFGERRGNSGNERA